MDKFGDFTPEPHPRTDFARTSIAFAKDIAERRQKMMFRGTDKEKQSRYVAVV